MGYKGKSIGISESDAHGGHGRGQSGQGNWGGHVAKENPGKPVIGHAMTKGKGYNTEAHTDAHHGASGEAVGMKGDNKPFNYEAPLHGEGKSMPHNGEGAHSPRAAHHHAPSGEAHRFPMNSSGQGFGHSMAQRKGVLRMSGHAKAHRLGCK